MLRTNWTVRALARVVRLRHPGQRDQPDVAAITRLISDGVLGYIQRDGPVVAHRGKQQLEVLDHHRLGERGVAKPPVVDDEIDIREHLLLAP